MTVSEEEKKMMDKIFGDFRNNIVCVSKLVKKPENLDYLISLYDAGGNDPRSSSDFACIIRCFGAIIMKRGVLKNTSYAVFESYIPTLIEECIKKLEAGSK